MCAIVPGVMEVQPHRSTAEPPRPGPDRAARLPEGRRVPVPPPTTRRGLFSRILGALVGVGAAGCADRPARSERAVPERGTPPGRIPPQRAVATFDDGDGWSVEFPDGLPGTGTSFAEVGACPRKEAREDARELVAAAHEVVGDCRDIRVEIEWRNLRAYEEWTRRQRSVLRNIRRHRAIASFKVEDRFWGDGAYWDIQFIGTVGDPEGNCTDLAFTNTVYGEYTKRDAILTAQYEVAMWYDYEGDVSKIPIEMEWRNEHLYREWMADHESRGRREDAHLRQIGVPHVLVRHRPNRRRDSVWIVDYPDGLGEFRGLLREVSEWSGPFRAAQMSIAAARGFAGAHTRIRVKLEYADADAYRKLLADQRQGRRPSRQLTDDEEKRRLREIGTHRAIGTLLKNRGRGHLWAIELPDLDPDGARPAAWLCWASSRPSEKDLVEEAQHLLAVLHDFDGDEEKIRVRAKWRNRAAYRRWQAERDAPLKEIGSPRAVSTFRMDPDRRALWLIEFPHRCVGGNFPTEVPVNSCAYELEDDILDGKKDIEPVRKAAAASGKREAVQTAQRLVAFAHDFAGDHSRIPVEMEWRNEAAYRDWLGFPAPPKAETT